jgi:hypothetical protein
VLKLKYKCTNLSWISIKVSILRNLERSNKAIISKADKGNFTVILYTEDYHDKVQSFIDNNNFTILNQDATITFQNQVKATIKNCQLIIPKDNNAKLAASVV